MLQFSRNIRKRGSRIENESVKMTKRVSKTALRSLVLGTPVDKGVARSNWRASLGNPTRTIVPAYHPGSKLGIAESANASATIRAGIAIINRLRVGAARGTGQAGSAVYLSNSVPYLDKLRAGYSPQQTTDWVHQALQEAQAEIRQTRLLQRSLSDGD